MNTSEKIKEIEDEIHRTQKNKATSFHIGLLKAKIAKLKREFITAAPKAGPGGDGFDVSKTGVARVGFIGFPSVGKSTLMSALTGTYSEAADYEFTTLTAVPGILHYNNARIQILDLPGIIEGAKDNKGKGKQVLSVARTCTLLVIVLDAAKSLGFKRLIEKELSGFGIKINKTKPNIKILKKDKGGINMVGNSIGEGDKVFTTAEIQSILAEFRIHNADIIVKGKASVDDLIDTIEGNRKYVPAIWVLNKIDKIGYEELEIVSRLPDCVPLSSNFQWNFDLFLEKVWAKLDLIRVYAKPKGQPISEEPVVLKASKSAVGDFCNAIHKSILAKFKYAHVWGNSVKHNPQKVGKEHNLVDGDVVQIVKSI